MKLASFIIKIACTGLGAFGGLIMFFTGFDVHAYYAFMGLALLGINGFFVGRTLETANFKELFPPKAPKPQQQYAPQNFANPQGFANTQSYNAPQGFANTQSYDAPQAFTNTQSYDAPQQPYAAPAAQPVYTAPQQPISPAQQSFNESLSNANQAYAASQQTTYSFDTPEDPQ